MLPGVHLTTRFIDVTDNTAEKTGFLYKLMHTTVRFTVEKGTVSTVNRTPA